MMSTFYHIVLMEIIICIAISIFPIKAEALLAPDYDFQTAVENAELIVRGRVIETRSEWVEGSYGRNIFTYVIIRVELAIKGDPISEDIAFRVMGGTVGDITQTVSDSASFFPDEEAIVLLSSPEYGPGILEVLPGYGKVPVIEETVSWAGSIIPVEDFVQALNTFIDNPDYNLDQLPDLYQDQSVPLIQDHTEKIEVHPSAPSVEVEEKEYQGRIQAVEREHLSIEQTGSPDLQPDKLPDWDNKIVITSVTDTGTTSDPIYDDQTIYVDFACVNSGDSDAGLFRYGLYIDETLVGYAEPTSLAAGYIAYVPDATINPLSAGTHTFKVVCDYNNQVSESNESNNQYSRTVTIKPRNHLPDLRPHKWSTWDNKIVISHDTNTHKTSDTIYDDRTIYVDFACVNSGDSAAGRFQIGLYIDGVQVKYTELNSLDSGFVATVSDAPIDPLSEGTHIFKVVCDYNDEVSESNEDNNQYSRTVIVIKDPYRPVISSISPIKGSAGTGTQVTIKGKGFGGTVGNGKVEFWYGRRHLGDPIRITAPIVSWADTQVVCEIPVSTINDYPASASSGPLRVVTDEGRLTNEVTFIVTFSYMGAMWDNLHSNPEVLYRVNENTSDCTIEGTSIRAAAEKWNNVRAAFSFRYAGTHNNIEQSQNGYNDIMWSNNLPTGVIAMAPYWFNNSSGIMIEADIVFNDKYYHWSSGSNPGLYECDIQSIVIHEFGHWLSLRDLYGDIGDGVNDVGKVMYGRSGPGEMKRNFHSSDIAGIRWIYGASHSHAMPWIPFLLLDE